MRRIGTTIAIIAFSVFLGVASVSSQTTEEERAQSIYKFIEDNYRTNWNAIPDSARELLILSRKIGNRQTEADANKFLGVYYYRRSTQDSSILFYKQAALINNELGNTLEKAKNTLNIGMSYRDLGEFEKTIEYSLEAARYFDEVSDYKGMSIVYNMIGSVYYYQKRPTEAIEYMTKYLEYAKKAEDIFEIASANQNLGAVLSGAGRDLEAIPYLLEASRIHKETDNSLGIANNAINIGGIYFNDGQFKEALTFYEEAYKAGKEMGNKRITLEAISSLTRTYANLERDREALVYSNEGVEIAKQAGDLFMEMDILEQKSKVLFNLGQFEEAYIVVGEFQSAKDSLINKENLEAIAELKTLYETEQKEKQIIELEKEKALQELTIQKNRVLQSGMGGILVVLIVAGFLWQSKVREKELGFKVEKLEVEKEIHAERERISRDLHDNVGAQLVNILSGIDLFERYKNSEKADESDHILVSLKEEAKSSIGQLRDTIWALKSDENTSESFVEHVSSYLKNVEKISELNVEVELSEIKKISLSPTQSLNMFRIVQEATQNVLKHSGATELKVFGEKKNEQLLVSIRDNGTFKESSTDGTSSGLNNMHKRARDLDGSLAINNTESGTNVDLTIPILM